MSDPVMDGAWAAFVDWASRQPDMVAAFNAATGRSFMVPARSGLDAMIDAACGKPKDDARAFVEWVTRECWGLEHAPDSYRASLPAPPEDQG